MNKAELLQYINNIDFDDSKEVIINGKAYKRDNKTIALIKILRNHKCQICSTSILKKDGSKYVEAAHIKPKYKRGIEKPHNIILLCPNHHKEFDYGNLKVIKHDNEKIDFNLNGNDYKIDLTFK